MPISASKRKIHKLIWSILDIGLIKNLRADWENQLQNYQSSSQLFSKQETYIKYLRNQTKIGLQTFRAYKTEVSTAYTKSKIEKTRGKNFWKPSTQLELYNGKTENFYRGNFSFINNNFTGNAFSIVGNQMFDGLKPGKNQVWSVIFNKH